MSTTEIGTLEVGRAGGDAQAIIDAAIESAHAQELAPEIYGVTIPLGAGHTVIDISDKIEAQEPEPRRKHERITLHTGDSLSQYVVKHNQGDGSAELFADVEEASVVAILNAPTESKAGWSDHRAHLALRFTDAWDRWSARDRQMMDQVVFAELIEEGLVDIAEPDSATLLEIATTFEAQSAANFKSATRLESGERQFRYEETIDARAGRQGDLVIPSEFILSLNPFEGSRAYAVTARLRYRLHDGKLTLGYILDRPKDILANAFDDVLEAIEEATSLTALRGTPA